MKREEFVKKLEKLGYEFLLKESPLFNLDEGNYSEYHLEKLMEILVMTLEKLFYKGDKYKLKSISFREITEKDKEFVEGENIYLLTYTQVYEETGKEAEFTIGDININPAMGRYDYQEQEIEGFIPLKDLIEKYGEYYGIIHYFFNFHLKLHIWTWALYNQDRIEKMEIGDTLRVPYCFDDWADFTLTRIDDREADREFTEDPRECMRSSVYYFNYKTDSGRSYYNSIDSFNFDFTLYSDRKKFC
nr:hypothetical protein [uncultured Leptotrichia sp.]